MRSLESIPNMKDVTSSFRGAVAQNVKEIRQKVDRKTARTVLDQIKKEEVFQQIEKSRKAEAVESIGEDNRHMIEELLGGSDLSIYKLRDLVSSDAGKGKKSFDLIDRVMSPEIPIEDISQSLRNIVHPSVKENLIKAKGLGVEVANDRKKERQEMIANEEKHITEIIQSQHELKDKLENLQAVSEESQGFSNTEVLLGRIDAFPENIQLNIQESMQETAWKKVEQILHKLTGRPSFDPKKRIAQTASLYLSALHSEMQRLEEKKGEYVSKKLSLEASSEDETSLDLIIKDVFKKTTENKLENEQKGGLEGSADIAAMIDGLKKSSEFAEQLVTIAEQASLFIGKDNGSIDIAIQQDRKLTSEELQEAENKRVELQAINKEVTDLENSMAASHSPGEIESIAGKISGLKKEAQKISGTIADKEKLVSSIMRKMADKITSKASTEGLRKMEDEFERIIKAVDVLSNEAFGVGIDDLSSNLPAIIKSIAESCESASEKIVDMINVEIIKAKGETPVPENKEDEKRGAFNMELMNEYVKKGGSAVELMLQYSTNWHCTEGSNSGSNGYLTDLNLNERLPLDFIRATRDDGYRYDLLRLDRSGGYGSYHAVSPTSKSVLWLPVSKDLASNRAEDLQRVFSEYRRMTSSTWNYMQNGCDRVHNSVSVDAKIHKTGTK